MIIFLIVIMLCYSNHIFIFELVDFSFFTHNFPFLGFAYKLNMCVFSFQIMKCPKHVPVIPYLN